YAPAALTQFCRDHPVLRGQPCARVDQKEDGIRFVYRLAGLPGHLVVDALGRDTFEPAGVDDEMRLRSDAPPAVMAITRQARHIGNDGVAGAREAVEKRRLAHIGPADDNDDGQHRYCTAIAKTPPLRV